MPSGRKPAETVSLSAFASDWGVTVRTVTNWLAEGMPCRTVDGQRRVVRSEANAWVRAKAADEAAPDEPENLAAAQLRYEAARAEKVELEVRRARGELVTVDDATKAVEAMLEQLRSQLQTLPQRWAPGVLGCKSLAEVTAKLDQAVTEAMTSLSEGA